MYRIGYRHEYHLLKILRSNGFFAVRSPKSQIPDIIAIKSGQILFFEVKSIDYYKTIYFDHETIDRLKEYANIAGATPYIAVKIRDTGDWHVIELDRLEKTGNRYVLREEVLRRSKNIYDILDESGQ